MAGRIQVSRGPSGTGPFGLYLSPSLTRLFITPVFIRLVFMGPVFMRPVFMRPVFMRPVFMSPAAHVSRLTNQQAAKLAGTRN